MAFEDYQTKESVVVMYTGEGKGKTSASLGLLLRSLGRGWKVAYIQFVKTWETGESIAIGKLIESKVFGDKFTYFKGGKGFYNAGTLSAKDVSADEHKQAARETFGRAMEYASSGDYDLVICDEINNATHDGLLKESDLKKLLSTHHAKTSICVTGRNFPEKFLPLIDIATNMTKLKHHFDEKYLANKGIDF